MISARLRSFCYHLLGVGVPRVLLIMSTRGHASVRLLFFFFLTINSHTPLFLVVTCDDHLINEPLNRMYFRYNQIKGLLASSTLIWISIT